MDQTQQLIVAVREATAGSPYVVEERPYGFAVTVDVADARWWTALRANGVRRVFSHEVRTDERSRKMSITDVEQSVRWGAGGTGAPSLRVERSFQRGRVYQYSMQKELGVDARTGRPGMPVSYTFRSGEGRDLIRAAAERTGWSEKMGAEQKGVLVFAISIVAVGALVGLFFLGQAILG